MFETQRNGAAQDVQDRFQLISGDCLKAGTDGLHSTTDIHTDTVGNDGVSRGQHPANGHAVSHMGIGHQRHMMKGAWQIGQMPGLGQRLLIQLLQPEIDGNIFGFQNAFHSASLLYLHSVI